MKSGTVSAFLRGYLIGACVIAVVSCGSSSDDNLLEEGTLCRRTSQPCEIGLFCSFFDGSCGESTERGICTAIPDVCPQVIDFVCGCDGMTYGNGCEAFRAGVSIAFAGRCGDQGDFDDDLSHQAL